MRSYRRQKGIGWFGLLLVLAVFGLFAVVGVKCLPIYLNQMKLASTLNKVAGDPGNANADVAQLRNSMQRFWDIEDIIHLTPRDIKVKRSEQGRFLSYDYEARERLFYNIYIVIHFEDDVPLRNAQSF
jgi:hypothetical protein